MKKDMVQRLSTQVGRLNEYAQVLYQLRLTGELLYRLGPYRILILTLLLTQLI
jgi:hypothetical protein